MKWYPWLNFSYQKIIAQYQRQSGGHHALLLHSQPGNGEESLSYALRRWLMCQKKNDTKSCGVCRGCKLMIANNHPDCYPLCQEERYPKGTIGIDDVRTVINNIHKRAHQDGVKIVWCPYTELLTEQASNSILKILEEPPEDTYFLLACQTPSRLLPTIRSRCLYWKISTPNEILGIFWLKHVGYNDSLSICAALRLCNYAPLAAQALLSPENWEARLSLFTTLQEAYYKKDFLILLPILLNQKKSDEPLRWLLSLLSDLIKNKQESTETFLINIDKKELVNLLSTYWSDRILKKQWEQWLQCFIQWREISNVNYELLLTYYLLNWEKDTINQDLARY
ncbi:DNA polymerase III subunit delta' C-terminal domain-containing protein [Sodalis sp. CWE]|uniref:DNA polymerase III subunit delta' C-terminal domain-containing protein n=1 Tax=Sodalis sp. CWE TaxID=2803816 RepID=UPI001C7E0BFC|nr:DNA polymerase III subunit delta' C-terminal domain-containing protein [Sodalis sp. CWE]MBX4181049.1 DNA polymerase III subunit delta' [Sodalis sp. CWE]